jgi:DNA-binding SARP family transcriptional activator
MVRFRLLGCIDLRDENGTELRSVLAQPKRLALLAYLAISSPRGACRRDTILAMFWPELDQERARRALNKSVHFLRRALGNDVVVSRTAEELVVTGERLWCDVVALEAAAKTSDHETATELYSGEVLPGLFVEDAQPFEKWLEGERARIRSIVARAARSLAEHNEASGKLTSAVSSARRAVELSSGDERVVRELLQLLDRLGDRAGALQAYERFAARLSTEFGAEPAAETQALIARVRARADAFASLASEAVASSTVEGDLRERLQAALGSGYTIERELGGGGMSRVFVVFEHALRRRVVMKVLAPEFAEGVSIVRFRREIQLAAQLAHPHIVPVLFAAEAAALPYYTMPLVEGESLRKRLETGEVLSIADVVAVLCDVAQALAYAHSHNIVHRDIKPDNVLLVEGSALVCDFGIAKAIVAARSGPSSDPLTRVGTSIGTPEYMAPEQAAGDPHANHLADIYSFGVMAFELLSGRPPFHDMTPQALLTAHISKQPRSIRELRADTPADLAKIVMQCLEKQPAARPTSAAVLVEALEAITSGRKHVRQRSRPTPARRWRVAVLTAVGLALLVSVPLALRLFGVGSHGSLIAAGVVGPNEQLVVADLTTRGGADSVLGALAAEGIRTDLVESKVVGVMPASVIRETLGEMRRAPNTPLDLPTALEIAERRGSRAVIHGDITPLGEGFVAIIRLVASTGGDQITSFREVAETPNELIPALERLSRSLRKSIGEKLRDIRATPALADVTTGSLDALKKYMASAKAGNSTRHAIPPLEEAVAIDSNFAMAWRRLSALYANFGYAASVIDSAAARAFRTRDHLKPYERALVEAMYYGNSRGGDRGKAIAIYEKLIRDRGLRRGVEAANLPLWYADRREFDRAEVLMRQLVEKGLSPTDRNTYENWPYILFNQGKLAATDSVITLAEPQPGTLRLTYMIATQQLASAERLSMQLRAADGAEWHDIAWLGQFVVDVTRGRKASAMRALARARSTGAPANAPVLELRDSIRAAEIYALVLDRRERVVRLLDATLTRIPLQSLAPLDRPYLAIATAYAKARRPDRARAVLAAFDREVRDPLVRRGVEHLQRRVLAEIALAEGRALNALTLFRQADLRPDGPADDCAVCHYLRLGRAFDAVENVDSAVFYYERYLTTPFFPYPGLLLDMKAESIGWVHYRLGELFDGRGERDRARAHYRQVAELWKDADAELQPKVAEARRRATRS